MERPELPTSRVPRQRARSHSDELPKHGDRRVAVWGATMCSRSVTDCCGPTKHRGVTALKLLVGCTPGPGGEFFTNFVTGDGGTRATRGEYEAFFTTLSPKILKLRS